MTNLGDIEVQDTCHFRTSAKWVEGEHSMEGRKPDFCKEITKPQVENTFQLLVGNTIINFLNDLWIGDSILSTHGQRWCQLCRCRTYSWYCPWCFHWRNCKSDPRWGSSLYFWAIKHIDPKSLSNTNHSSCPDGDILLSTRILLITVDHLATFGKWFSLNYHR